MLDLTTAWDRPCRNRTSPIGVERFLRVRLRPRAGGNGLAAHVALALDTSGSMEGRKLEEARRACLAAARLLRPQDRLSLIAFSTGVQEVVRDQSMGSVDLPDLERRLAALRAEGVTRADLALRWLEDALQGHQGARFAVLATDGHPTDPRGQTLEDFAELHRLAGRLGEAGVNLSSLGLGDARNFHTALLVDLVDRGRGRFLHALSDGELAGLLGEHFQQAQAVGAEAVLVTLAPEMQGLELHACCQIAPTYLPMDRPDPAGGPWKVQVHNVRGDVDTDLLFHFRLPSPRFGEREGPRRVLTVEALLPGTTGQARAEASIENVASLRDEQQLNREVHDARALWDLNTYQDAILHSSDLNRTGELLQGLVKSAREAGQGQVAAVAQQQLDQLVASGQIDPNRSARLSQSLRNQAGGPGGFGAAPVPGSRLPLHPQNAVLRPVCPPGQDFPLSGLRMLAGRSVDAARVQVDLTPLDAEPPCKVSRRHAEFLWTGGTLQIRDLGSTNGTWVNGERLQGTEPGQPSKPVDLAAGDRIRLAHLEFEVTTATPGGN